jgi:hypothetical protein
LHLPGDGERAAEEVDVADPDADCFSEPQSAGGAEFDDKPLAMTPQAACQTERKRMLTA